MIDPRSRSRAAAEALGGSLTVLILVGLAILALVLTVLTQRAPWIDVPRHGLEDVLLPARQVAAAPFRAVDRLTAGVRERVRLEEENERLREENARLRAWYDLALAMRDKMERYERLLGVQAEPNVDVITARVVAETDGPFVRSRLINAGRREAIAKGDAVATERGLLGRIVAVGDRSARVLLLTDLNSRVPVMVERHDVRAILAGDNRPSPTLAFLPRGHGLVNGDRIVTSGDAGGLPRGLIIGEAFANDRGEWRVRLFADDSPYDYVRVLKFAFPGAPEADGPAGAEAGDEGGDEAGPAATAAGSTARRDG